MEAPATTPASQDKKVVILLKATGSAPLLKQNKFKISGSDRFSKVMAFVRKQTNVDSLFLYCNSAFSPSMDALVSELFENFGTEGMLVINYAVSPAWG